MPEVLYIGPHSPLAAASAKIVRKAGHEFTVFSTSQALRGLQNKACGAIVVWWRSGQRGPSIAKAAKKQGIPVIVVTNRIVTAFQIFGSLVDILLEQPAGPEEVGGLAVWLINRRTSPKGKQLASVAGAG
jgi:ABC-type sugar transport system substrate-binding protein